MKQSLVMGLTLIFLLLFNCVSASILDTIAFNNSNEGNAFELSSYELGNGSTDLGKIVINGVRYDLPNSVELTIGELYVIGYMPEEGYEFDHWEIEGGELKSSKNQQANILKATNSSGKIIAVYRKMKERTTITETIVEITEGKEYELPLGKFISLRMHEIIEEHKSNIYSWIFEHKLLILEKNVEKLKVIEDYQNDLKQRFLEIKKEMEELEENLTNGIIDEEGYIIQMEILRSELSALNDSNEKLGHILGGISKTFSEELREKVEEKKGIHSKFKDELNEFKKELKIKTMQIKTKILKTEKSIHTKTTKIPPGQTQTKKDKSKGKD